MSSLLTMALLVTGSISVLAAPETGGGGNQETQYGWYLAEDTDLTGNNVDFIMVSNIKKRVLGKENDETGE